MQQLHRGQGFKKNTKTVAENTIECCDCGFRFSHVHWEAFKLPVKLPVAIAVLAMCIGKSS